MQMHEFKNMPHNEKCDKLRARAKYMNNHTYHVELRQKAHEAAKRRSKPRGRNDESVKDERASHSRKRWGAVSERTKNIEANQHFQS